MGGGAAGGKVVGIAAGKRPIPTVDSEDPATARYIESVWVAPGVRRRRLGERLIKYLLTAEYLDNHCIRQFLLWVYVTNGPAMRLYEHIGFVPTQEKNVGARTEIKYRLDFDPQSGTRRSASWRTMFTGMICSIAESPTGCLASRDPELPSRVSASSIEDASPRSASTPAHRSRSRCQAAT